MEEFGCNISTECPVVDNQDYQTLQTNRQKKPSVTIQETSRFVQLKWVKKWPQLYVC